MARLGNQIPPSPSWSFCISSAELVLPVLSISRFFSPSNPSPICHFSYVILCTRKDIRVFPHLDPVKEGSSTQP